MKTYEEMARDVLKRRDEELQLTSKDPLSFSAPPEVVYPASPKKRRLFPRIAIPCAAAVTAAAVGICIWNKIPQRGRYINQLIASEEPLTDQDKLDYIYSEFNSNKYKYPIIPVTFESVYMGGKTEININKAEVRDVYPFYEMNSLPPDTPKDEDFISIADEGINSYYGMEFDRLSTVFENWKSEHEPFGYYDRDIETSGTVEHSVHGYYTLNSISYTTEGGIKFAVSASFNKFTAAVENARASVINGFDAMVYQLPNGGFVVDIDMGATVRIDASRVHKDTLIKIIDAYTKPRAELTKVSFEEINILDEMPAFLLENDPFAAESTDGCEIKNIDAEYANKYYNMEFDRLGKLHKDWYEDGKDDLKIYLRFEDTLVKDVCEINTLYYTTPNYSDIYVRANIGYIPEPETDFYDVSYVNGHYAVIYRGGRIGYDDKIYPNNDAKFGALVEFGGTVVNITSAGLSEEEFLAVLDEYTSPDGKTDTDKNTETENSVKVLDGMPDCLSHLAYNTNTDDYKVVPYTIEQLNDLYGIEFDRLGKLHKEWNWNVQNDGLKILVRDELVSTSGGEIERVSETVNTTNTLHYWGAFGGASVNVTASCDGAFLDRSDPEIFSTINGYRAVIWETESIIEVVGSRCFGAMIEMGGTLVHIGADEIITEEEFISILNEYTAV